MHVPTILTVLTTPLCVQSLSLSQPAFDTANLSPLAQRQTSTPDRHITDFRGWEIQSCAGENQGVWTITQSQLGQCFDVPVVVRALTLNRIEEGCTSKSCSGYHMPLMVEAASGRGNRPARRWGESRQVLISAVYLFDEAGCAGNAQALSAKTTCESAVSSMERWKTFIVACAGP